MADKYDIGDRIRTTTNFTVGSIQIPKTSSGIVEGIKKGAFGSVSELTIHFLHQNVTLNVKPKYIVPYAT